MKPVAICALPLVLLFTVASVSATISMTLTNKSGEELTAVSAVPINATADQTQNAIGEPIPTGDIGTATINTVEDNCLFNLTFTFVSGKTTERASTDVCQTDGIIVE